MNGDDVFWKEFRIEIKEELENIDKLEKELRENMAIRNKFNNLRQIGSILHDFYNCCERIFKKITTDINGGFEQRENWHKELLYRMTISMEDIRPPVLSKKLAAELDEYLSFRHLFRNIYGFELENDRLDRLVAKFEPVSRSFRKQITEFLRKMEK